MEIFLQILFYLWTSINL